LCDHPVDIKLCIFLKIYYQDLILKGSSNVTTYQLPTAPQGFWEMKSYKVARWSGLHLHAVHTTFHMKTGQLVSTILIKRTCIHRQPDIHSLITVF